MRVLSFKFRSLLASCTLHLVTFMLPAAAFSAEPAQVFVTKGPIKKGQAIRAEDIGVEERVFSVMPRDVILEGGNITEMIAKRDLRPGTVIRGGMLDSRKMVKRGEPVTIVAESGGMKVTASGQAMGDGGEGKFIKVLNLSSRKVIVGRIVADSTVSVSF